MPQTSGVIAGLGRVRLTLEPTPQPSETGGSILTTAILTRGERRDPIEPIEGEMIFFWLGPDEVYSHPTDDHGRASYTFTGLGFGTHAISVQCGGISVTYRHTFERKGFGFNRKIVVLGTAIQPEGFEVVFHRLGRGGTREAGRVAAWDWEDRGNRLAWAYHEWDITADRPLSVSFRLLDAERTIEFFLPDDPHDTEARASVEIPARPRRLPEPPAQSGAESQPSPFERGRARARRVLGR